MTKESCNEQSQETYVEYCRDIGEKRTEHLKENLSKNINEMLNIESTLLEKYSVSVTGSDGRKENCDKTSPYEFLILSNLGDGASIQNRKALLNVITSSLENGYLFEEKDLIKADLINYKRNPNLIFFERLIDTSYVFGNESFLFESKKQLQKEVENDLRKIHKRYTSRLKEYRQINKNKGLGKFKGRGIEHYQETDNEIVLFFDKENGIASVKYSHLRVLQNSILLKIVKSLKEEKTKVSFENIPGNTIEKVKYLVERSIVNFTNEDISEIEEVYGYFLSLYHKSGNNFFYTNQKETSINSNEIAKFKDATKSLNLFSSILRS